MKVVAGEESLEMTEEKRDEREDFRDSISVIRAELPLRLEESVEEDQVIGRMASNSDWLGRSFL